MSESDPRWADVILVMEEKHRSRLKAEYTRLLEFKPVHVLDIPDDYKYMDPELITLLQQAVPAILMLEQDR
ncbi:protein tyrosine phosphatase [Herbaspirillum sp. WGmk3]|uniref:protein tyrosine phosphatase n=1 Tax=Herbaspirillum sp. WGmk3 TaxID=2919925 RepID=UPI002090C5B1|nr:protein tyrosine phosphatase [Herbaspirillum sp. WGmk3]